MVVEQAHRVAVGVLPFFEKISIHSIVVECGCMGKFQGGLCEDCPLRLGLFGESLLMSERGVFKWNGDRVAFGVECYVCHAGQKKALGTLDVILLDIGITEFKLNCPSAVFVGIVGEVLAGLDVILVGVGPVEMNLLAVVGNRVFVALRIATQRHKIARVVVTAEKGEEVIENLGFLLGIRSCCCRTVAQSKILLAEFTAVILRSKVAFYVQRLVAEGFLDLGLDFFELLCKTGFLRERARLQLFFYASEQVLFDELLNDRPLLVHDSLNAEIQFVAVGLKQLLQ